MRENVVCITSAQEYSRLMHRVLVRSCQRVLSRFLTRLKIFLCKANVGYNINCTVDRSVGV